MAEAHMSDIETAARFPGIDAPKALKRFKGNAAFFIRLLCMFESHYARIGDDIRQALDAGDMEKAGQLSHALKGAAINLEAWELFEASRALEAAVKSRESRDDLNRLFAAFETAFHTVRASAKGLARHFDADEKTF